MCDDGHEKLIKKGLKLHEAFKYDKALPFFEEAYKIAPKCLCAMYNYANVLHMLNRDEEAYDILLELINTSPEDAKKDCPDLYSPRSLITDAYFLLFNVKICGFGFSDEAFEYAQEHLSRRSRGLESVWTKKQILKQIAEYEEEWRNS